MPKMLGLQAARDAKKLSRNALANSIQVSRTTIVKLEEGEIEDPSYSLVMDLASALGVTAESLFLLPNSAIALDTQTTKESA